jgi:hypothetical protein
MDPHNTHNQLAFAEARKRVNKVWGRYQEGGLDEYTNQLVDLFIAMWFWDADLPGTPLFDTANLGI